MLAMLIVILAGGGYTASVFHHIEVRTQRENTITSHIAYMTRLGNALQAGTPEEQARIIAEAPAGVNVSYLQIPIHKSVKEYVEAVNAHLNYLQKQLKADAAFADKESKELKIAFFTVVFTLLCLIVFCDRFMVTHLVKPLIVIRQHFNTIASGDLTHEPIDMGRNCVGQLVPLLSHMQRSLLTTVQSVSDNTIVLRREAADIADGNIELSDRTTRQAAALEETAASMEQLTATVQNNAKGASEALTLSSNTTNTTRQGEMQVKSVASMMEGIASEAEKIRQFTSTVNSIAFQTNILALNAAVEAARAGEQGRGFAVVASEVRTLAQRSAEAAKEIEGLIKGTEERVNQAASAAKGAGKSMEYITQNVSAVNGLISQISLASEEQSKGISQIALAVADLDRVTQQNATLVQTVTASASSLNGRTETLASVISHFSFPSRGTSLMHTGEVNTAHQKETAVKNAEKEGWTEFS